MEQIVVVLDQYAQKHMFSNVYIIIKVKRVYMIRRFRIKRCGRKTYKLLRNIIYRIFFGSFSHVLNNTNIINGTR